MGRSADQSTLIRSDCFSTSLVLRLLKTKAIICTSVVITTDLTTDRSVKVPCIIRDTAQDCEDSCLSSSIITTAHEQTIKLRKSILQQWRSPVCQCAHQQRGKWRFISLEISYSCHIIFSKLLFISSFQFQFLSSTLRKMSLLFLFTLTSLF